MQLTKPLELIAAVVLAITLSACGGGGSSPVNVAPPASAASITLSGVAGPGLLSFARVSAHAVTAFGPDTLALAVGKTDAQGRYSLRIPAGYNTVMVRVESIAGETLMLDTTRRWQGEFVQVPAPAGLVLRALALTATSSDSVLAHVHLLSEGATQVASRTRDPQGLSLAWSSQAVAAGQEWARQMVPAGVDPFSTEPTGLVAVKTNTAAQNRLLLQTMGFMQHASTCVDDGVLLSGADLLCAIEALMGSTANTLDGLNVKFQFSKEMLEWRYRWQSAAVSAAIGTPLLDLARNELAVLQAVSGPVGALPLPAAATEMERFVTGLREGFRTSESTLSDTDNALQRRYAQVTSSGSQAVADALGEISQQCKVEQEQLRCDGPWTPVQGGFERVRQAEGSLGTRVDTRLEISGTASSGFRARYRSTQSLQTRSLSQLELEVFIEGFDGSGRLTGSTARLQLGGLYTAWDDVDSSRWVRLELRRLDLRAIDENLQQMELSGELILSTNFGDKLSGLLEYKARRLQSPASVATQIVRLYANLRAEVTPSANTQVAVLTILGSTTPKPYSTLGYGTYNLQVFLDLSTGTRLSLELGKSSPTLATGLLTVASSGIEILLTVEASGLSGRYCLPGDDADLCSNILRVYSRDGRYTAVIDGSTLTGDIFYENQKIGTITRTSITINGREYSLF